MSAPQTTVDEIAGDELATFTVFSAASGKVYACGVPVDVAAGWTAPYGGRPEDLLALELCDSVAVVSRHARDRRDAHHLSER